MVAILKEDGLEWTLGCLEDKMETLDYFECPECGDYSPEGGWCESCLDKVDIEEYEERKREWLAEQQEY